MSNSDIHMQFPANASKIELENINFPSHNDLKQQHIFALVSIPNIRFHPLATQHTSKSTHNKSKQKNQCNTKHPQMRIPTIINKVKKMQSPKKARKSNKNNNNNKKKVFQNKKKARKLVFKKEQKSILKHVTHKNADSNKQKKSVFQTKQTDDLTIQTILKQLATLIQTNTHR